MMNSTGSMNRMLVALTAMLASFANVNAFDTPYHGENIQLNSPESPYRPQLTKPDPADGLELSQQRYHYHGSQLENAKQMFHDAIESIVGTSHAHLTPGEKYRHYELLGNRLSTSNYENLPINDETRFGEDASDRGEKPYSFQWETRDKLDITKRLNTLHGLDNDIQTADMVYLSTESNTNKPPPTKAGKAQNGWLSAFSIFAIWSLDNLFWLIPFIAHSKYNVFYFFFSYQSVVLVSYVLGSSSHMSSAHAHALNIIWGAFGAAFCWLLAFLFFLRRQKALIAMSSTIAENDEDVFQKESDLEAPLLVVPIFGGDALSNLMLDQVPSATLTIGMTLLSTMDDLFFIPVMAERPNIITVTQLFVGSIIAVFLWSGISVVVASRYRDKLVAVPLFFVICMYASVMTGHCMWDFVHIAPKLHLQQVKLEYLNFFFEP